MMTLSVATHSSVGGRRNNEDSIGTARNGASLCCVLSDGAGGHGGGAIASKLVVNHVIEGFNARPPRDPHDLGDLILDAHDVVIRKQREMRGAAADMHATVVVLMIDESNRRAFWGHVGDSRLYMLRSAEVRTVTQDDSVVQSLVRAGELDRDAARTYPNKHQLLAALGMCDRIEPNMSDGATEPEEGDAFLLCSDGWWECLSDADIAASLGGATSPDHWLDWMQHLIAARGGPRHDNYSAAGVWVGDLDRTVVIAQRHR
jgi:serine/threonine protein phosphatase PrpC